MYNIYKNKIAKVVARLRDLGPKIAMQRQSCKSCNANAVHRRKEGGGPGA